MQSSFFGTLSQQGLNPIKLSCKPSQPDRQLYQQPEPLSNWVSMLAVLVTGPAFTQNLSFFP